MPKHMNNGYRLTMNLQLFAEGGDDGDDSGEGDDQDGEEPDEDGEEDENEKKYSQKDVDDVVKKRLAREKRKWERDQKKKNNPNSKDKTGDTEESEDVKARKAAEDRASKAEAKNACYEAGVTKDAVDDVVALARSYMAAEEELDLEDAIERVVKKYPQFKNKTASDADDTEEKEGKKKSWGERQKGRAPKKISGVEKAFYDLNPDLKE